MKLFSKLMAGAVMASSLVIASGANADDLPSLGSYSIKGVAKTAMTYTTAAQVGTSRTSAYNGVGTIFVNTVATGLDHGYLCTASLINSHTVLSAAHCIYDHDEETGALDPVTRIQLYLPSFGERGQAGTEVFNITASAFNPLYNSLTDPGFGDIGSGHDVSLMTLDRDAVGHDTYSLYTGNSPLGTYTEVGTGSVGGPTGTNTGTPDFEKRVGTNIFEYYGSQVFSDVTRGVVLSDFDDGTAAHDVFGSIGGNKQTGVAGEADSSPGDSGGPEFNAAGQIVSVTSFGITAGIFSQTTAFPDGFCGTGSIDPYSSGGGTTPVSVDSGLCTNSSVGELAGDTLVSYNTAFINSYLAAHPNAGAVPEAATWSMMILGMGGIGASLRRRKVRATVAVA